MKDGGRFTYAHDRLKEFAAQVGQGSRIGRHGTSKCSYFVLIRRGRDVNGRDYFLRRAAPDPKARRCLALTKYRQNIK